MRIEDYKDSVLVLSDDEVEQMLLRRYGENVNEFWLTATEDRFPAMSILVKGEVAALTYVFRAREPGWVSKGPLAALDPKGWTTFCVNTPTEALVVSNENVVPFAVALDAAKELLLTGNMPTCIVWLEL